jgi:hypothetical protein
MNYSIPLSFRSQTGSGRVDVPVFPRMCRCGGC